MAKEKNRYIKQHKANERYAIATQHLNFGAVVFMVIFIYIVILLVNFAMKEQVNYTVAEAGMMSDSATYKGLVLRNETLVTAPEAGDIKYFFPEGARVRSGNPVFGIIKDPALLSILEKEIFKASQNLSADDPAFDESYNFLKNRMKNYVLNNHDKAYSYTYVARKQIDASITEIRNTLLIKESGSRSTNKLNSLEAQYDDALTLVKAPHSGLVSYKIDGMETMNGDNFDISFLNVTPEMNDTTTKHRAQNGQPVFKVIDNYLWYIAAEIDDECEKQIEGKNYVGVDFIDKDIQIDVRARVFDEGQGTYLILEMDRMVSEFLTDRHVNFKITYENHRGIKIPETAITKKTFAKIPAQYLMYVKKEYAVRKKVASKDSPGGETLSPTSVPLHKRAGEWVFVPLGDELKEGDVLSYTDPTTYETIEFTIDETEEMEGVYVINKGYAVFKLIETQYREQGYRIVTSDLDYGLRIYDRIATEAASTKEYQIVH